MNHYLMLKPWINIFTIMIIYLNTKYILYRKLLNLSLDIADKQITELALSIIHDKTTMVNND